jgi:hypothetical protein
MPNSHNGMHYLLQAMEPVIGWPKACASCKNDSKSWVKFIYEEIICHFGCILCFLVDGGSEFKGATEILFKQYRIMVIMTSPYLPHNNGMAEHTHPTLYNSLFRVGGTDILK